MRERQQLGSSWKWEVWQEGKDQAGCEEQGLLWVVPELWEQGLCLLHCLSTQRQEAETRARSPAPKSDPET